MYRRGKMFERVLFFFFHNNALINLFSLLGFSTEHDLVREWTSEREMYRPRARKKRDNLYTVMICRTNAPISWSSCVNCIFIENSRIIILFMICYDDCMQAPYIYTLCECDKSASMSFCISTTTTIAAATSSIATTLHARQIDAHKMFNRFAWRYSQSHFAYRS